MRIIKRRNVARLGAALLLLATASCSSSEQNNAGDQGGAENITIALGSFGNEQLDPTMEVGASAANVLLPLYDSLLEIGTDGSLQPGLAEKWSVAPDGITWTFNVRKGVQFHEGWGEVTADDVKFSIERWQSEQAVAADSPNLRAKVDHVNVVDPYTVQVVTKGVQVDLPYMFAPQQNSSGMVFSKKYLTEKAGNDFAAQTKLLNEKPIGSGPFEFVSHKRGASVTYKAVDKHWRATPHVKQVTFVLVPEDTTRVAMLKNGEADIIEASGDDVADLKASGLEVRTVPDSQDISVTFTGTYRTPALNKPTAKPLVRQALSLAIDRETILKTIMNDQGGLPETPFDTIATTHDIDAAHYASWAEENNKYDPEQAKKLLADAGYPDGFGGIKMYSYTRPGAPFLPKIAEVVVSEWKQIGVQAEIVATDYASYREHKDRAKLDDPVLAGDVSVYNIQTRFEPIGVLDTYFNYTGGNVQFLMDPSLDQQINQIAGTADDAARQALVQQVFDRIDDTWVVLPLFHADALYGVNPKSVGKWQTFQGWPFFGRMLETIS
jgi:peptide/nickel transport system substrate-binding protein